MSLSVSCPSWNSINFPWICSVGDFASLKQVAGLRRTPSLEPVVLPFFSLFNQARNNEVFSSMKWNVACSHWCCEWALISKFPSSLLSQVAALPPDFFTPFSILFLTSRLFSFLCVATAMALSFTNDWKDTFPYANKDDDLLLVNFTASSPNCCGANYSIQRKKEDVKSIAKCTCEGIHCSHSELLW